MGTRSRDDSTGRPTSWPSLTSMATRTPERPQAKATHQQGGRPSERRIILPLHLRARFPPALIIAVGSGSWWSPVNSNVMLQKDRRELT